MREILYYGISEESKERLRDLAKMQNRENGKFSTGYKGNLPSF